MKREDLKNILLNYYVDSTTNHILRGIRKPSYEVMVELDKNHNIPFNVWTDIKSYITNDTKQSDLKTTHKNTEEVA